MKERERIIRDAENCSGSADRFGDYDVITIATARHLINRAFVEGAKTTKTTLWAIANMQIQEHTDIKEVLESCLSMAKLDLQVIERLLAEVDP